MSSSRRNLLAVTAASFLGFTGFTIVMPFLPLFMRQLGVSDVGEIALWAGASLGVTPALTALMSPLWGRLADRSGRKIMIGRSLASCVIVMTAMAFVTRAWHVFALRAVLGLLTGYGALSLTMAAESAPGRMASAIGLVQTAQRLGPAIGPAVGGIVAGVLGLRQAFLVSAGLYAIALMVVLALYDERVTHARADERPDRGPVTFRNVLAFENFVLLMVVIFGCQFVDRSVGPILPLYIEQFGVERGRVPLVAGTLFSAAALAGALGHHVCGRLLARSSPRAVISGGAMAAACAAAAIAASTNLWVIGGAMALLGAGIGAAMTAAYASAGAVIPAGSHGAGFGVLSSASLAGLALSPVVAGLLGATSLRAVFVVDLGVMALVGGLVRRLMRDRRLAA